MMYLKLKNEKTYFTWIILFKCKKIVFLVEGGKDISTALAKVATSTLTKLNWNE